MRFTLSSAALSNTLNMLCKVIASKNSLPILDSFLFEVTNGTMKVTASDSDNIIRSTIALTEADSDGEFCIPNHTILNALKDMPDQPLTFDIDLESYALHVSFQNGTYNFTAQSAEEYPRPQDISSGCTTIELPAETMIDNITRSLFATANDELRPVMNGVFFDVTADCLAIVASDGHKLVRNRNYNIKSEQPASVNFPKKPATLLKNILTKEDGDVTIQFSDKSAQITFGVTTINCRLLEGRYPNYNSVIPMDNPCEVTVDRRMLLSAIRRVLPFASESSQLIRLHIEGGRLDVSSEDLDFATSAKESLLCDYNGMKMDIGFKGTSLMEILNNLACDHIIMKLADPSRAGVIVPAEQPENEDVLMLLMPMLLNN